MDRNSSPNRQTTSVAGGSSAEPTPANNVGGGLGWGDQIWMGGKGLGTGHIDPPNAKATMGEFLGLQDQKSRADLAADNQYSMTPAGEPTCITEDHSFMLKKPGGPDTLPGWNTLKDYVAR